MKKNSHISAFLAILIITYNVSANTVWPDNKQKREFPLTNFSKHSINLSEIRNDGTNRNSIPTVKNPLFYDTRSIKDLGANEPVISVTINQESRAYPLRILIWHEVINDRINGIPILITYSPLSSSAAIFNRQLNGNSLSFGNTGRLRHFNTIIFDELTESWWQQYTGTAIIGDYLGTQLRKIPHKRESFEVFKNRTRNQSSKVLVPKRPNFRKYGTTPFIRMDSNLFDKSLFPYKIPSGINPIERVIVVTNQAWPLRLLVQHGKLAKDNLTLSWWPGQNSVHDTHWIPFGKDIGNVSVIKNEDGKWINVIYDEVFAFTFAAFNPNGRWNLKP